MYHREFKKTMYVKFLSYTLIGIKHALYNKPLASWEKYGSGLWVFPSIYREDKNNQKIIVLCSWFCARGSGNTRKEQITLLHKTGLIKK